MLPLLALADGLAADLRLRVAMTFEERYLPLSEFASRLQKQVGGRVKVDSGMGTRKLTLFVNGKPIAETMRMVAEAMGGRWVTVGPEWRLQPDKDVLADEKADEAANRAARQASLLAWAKQMETEGPIEGHDMLNKASKLIAWLGPEIVAQRLFTGQPLAASTDGRWGSIRLPSVGVENDGKSMKSVDGLLVLAYDPQFGSVRASFSPFGTSGNGWTVIEGGSLPILRTALDRRTKAWSIGVDPTVLSTPLKPLPLGEAPSPTGGMGLADALARIHVRSGLPVAGEAFRVALRHFEDLDGPTVADALRTLAVPFTGEIFGPPGLSWPDQAPAFTWRSQDGWLLARPTQAWRFRPGEIPEASLAPLERKGKTPSLDEYSRLAGSLDEDQAQTVRDDLRPLVYFPKNKFGDAYWGLALYGALSSSLRTQARQGLAFDELPPRAQSIWKQASFSEANFEAAFNGLPKGKMAFQAELGWGGLENFVPDPPLGGRTNLSFKPYSGVHFVFGPEGNGPSCFFEFAPDGR